MTRIENTAHKPAAGWDPAVGNGVVDLLAAVGDQVLAVAAPKGKAVEPPRHVEPDDRHTGTVAVSGAAACLAGLVAIAAFPGYGVGRSVLTSRATSAASRPSSGPAGKVATRGQGATAGVPARPSATAVAELAQREANSGIGDEVAHRRSGATGEIGDRDIGASSRGIRT